MFMFCAFPHQPLRKFGLGIAVGTAVVVVVLVINILLNPLRKSEAAIEQYILRETPIGTTREEVRTTIRRNGWELWQDRDIGYRDFAGFGVKGTRSISAIVGKYSEIPIPFETVIVVWWGFDDADKLIDITLRKETDAM